MDLHSIFFMFFLFFFVALFYVSCILLFFYKTTSAKIIGSVILISSTVIALQVAKINKLQSNCINQARDGICVIDTRNWKLWEDKIVPNFYKGKKE